MSQKLSHLTSLRRILEVKQKEVRGAAARQGAPWGTPVGGLLQRLTDARLPPVPLWTRGSWCCLHDQGFPQRATESPERGAVPRGHAVPLLVSKQPLRPALSLFKISQGSAYIFFKGSNSKYLGLSDPRGKIEQFLLKGCSY